MITEIEGSFRHPLDFTYHLQNVCPTTAPLLSLVHCAAGLSPLKLSTHLLAPFFNLCAAVFASAAGGSGGPKADGILQLLHPPTRVS